MTSSTGPSTELERSLVGAGPVIGIDEVGRGAWAGPLAVGVAALRPDELGSDSTNAGGERSVFARVRDSKALNERSREAMFDELADRCDWAVGWATPIECDLLGMADAQRLATSRALESLGALGVEPGVAIADGRWDFVTPLVPRVEMRVKADRDHLCVAVASIIAKVVRDREMRRLAEELPQWHFQSNKGYPCVRHRAALLGYGPSSMHRRSWVFMDNQPWTGLVRTLREPTLF